jgi:hypothetical protein
MTTQKQDDEWIRVIKEKSEVDDEITEWFGWEKAIKGKRAVPYHSKIDTSRGGWTAVEGKARGKDAILIHFAIDTGITLSYKGKEWRETTGLQIELPFDKASEIARDIQKTLKRYRKHKDDLR